MKLRNNYYLRNKDTGYVISFTTRKEQMIFYNELKDWEVVDIVTKSNDATTAEPLIKDEKVRKAVLAWAEAECITKAYLENDYTICRDDDVDVIISFCVPVFKGVRGASHYTIAELCGEEEE